MRLAFLVPALLTLLVGSSARADSGLLHLHADFGFGGALAGGASYHHAGDEHSLGGLIGLGIDWQFRRPFALEALFQAGGFTQAFPTSGKTGASYLSISGGMRFRLLDDRRGYLGERGGRAGGNLWLAPHVGIYSFDSVQYGFDFSAGYEFSIHRPVSIGPFVRAMTLIGGSTSGADVILIFGVGSSFEVMDPPSTDDIDQDGVSDDEEARLGTNPRNADTDGDGLPDRLEIDTNTDPRAADTDGDGLSDGYEDNNANGLLDLEETDPRDFDTDGGGISDGDEVFTYHTDPRSARDDDRDGDGVANYADRCPDTAAHAAVDATGCAAQAAHVDFVAVQFVNGRTRMTAAGITAMGALATTLASGRSEILVYVSSSGDAAADASRAQLRADALATWLAEHNVARESYTITASGADPDAARTSDVNVAQLQITRH